jgi:cellulose synthase/poly-beta-1,6-N-acetylglucosamine synthase-like glycosyltransferase
LGTEHVAAQYPHIQTVAGGRHVVPEVLGLVTVAVAAHNEELVIARCLESLRRSTYPHFEVIVADDASTDRTRSIVRDFRLKHPDMRLQVYRMKKNVGKGGALNAVLRRHARGEFVMTLDADSIVTPKTIANAVAYFDDQTVAGVAANVQILDEPTVLGVLQKFEHMVGYRSKKMYSLLNCEFVVGGVASTYRTRVLRQVGFYDTDTVTEDIGLSTKIVNLGNRRYRMVYASDVVAMTEGVMNFRALVKQRFRWKYGSLQNLVKYRRLVFNPSGRYSRSLTVYRMPMAIFSEVALLVSPLAWTYALYMTITQYNPGLMIGAYLTITAYMLVTIWFDENISAWSRINLTFYAPIAYFIFYIMDLVQLLAIFRCLFRSSALFRQKDIGSTWVSPQRLGKQLAGVNEA